MPDLASAFLGAIIGGLSSLLGTWLTLRGRTDYFDDLALMQLKEMLDKDKDASMTKLLAWGKAIGMTEAETRQLIFLAKRHSR